MTNEDRPLTDEELERAVGDQLFSDPKIGIDASIVVSVENGEVTLRGTVAGFGDKRAARSAAQLVKGVKSVKDELEVLGPSDADLRRAVLEALGLDSRIPATIDAMLDEGVVTLTGQVPGQLQRDAAMFIAENVPGVVGVDNQTRVGDQPQEAADAEEPIGGALDRLANLDVDGPPEGADRTRLDLRDRLASALRRIQKIRSDSEAAGNVVRFHLARHVESLESDAVDAVARLTTLTDDRSYEWRILERDVIALEGEVAVAQAKLEAAQAEERDDPRGEIEAEARAFEAETGEVKAELDQAFGRKGKGAARSGDVQPAVSPEPANPKDPGAH